MTPKSQFHNEFVGLSEVPVPEYIPDFGAHRSSNQIYLDDVHVPEKK